MTTQTSWECARCGSTFTTKALLDIHSVEPHSTDRARQADILPGATTNALDVIGAGAERMKKDLLRYLAYRENCKRDFPKAELWSWFHRLEGVLASWTLLNDQLGHGSAVYISDAVDAARHLGFDLLAIKDRIRNS